MKKAKFRKLICLCATLMTTFAVVAAPSASAESTGVEPEENTYTTEYIFYVGDNAQANSTQMDLLSDAATRSSGLISNTQVSLSLTAIGANTLDLYVRTESSETMDKIGIKSMKIQKYVNGLWEDYLSASDIYSTNATYNVEKRTFIVMKDYSYRLTVTHYAEKKVFLVFTDKQELTDTTGAVWVD